MKGGDGKSYELVSCAIDGFVNPFCPWPMPMLEPGLEKPDLGHTQRNGLDPILDSVDISGHGIIAKAKQQAPIGDRGKKQWQRHLLLLHLKKQQQGSHGNHTRPRISNGPFSDAKTLLPHPLLPSTRTHPHIF